MYKICEMFLLVVLDLDLLKNIDIIGFSLAKTPVIYDIEEFGDNAVSSVKKISLKLLFVSLLFTNVSVKLEAI